MSFPHEHPQQPHGLATGQPQQHSPAPQYTQQPQQQQQHYAQPQQQYVPPQQPQYAAPHAQQTQQHPGFTNYTAGAGGASASRAKVFGFIALGFMVLDAAFNLLIPFLIRVVQLNYNLSLYSFISGGVQWTLIVLALLAGIIGLTQKGRAPGHWSVYAALGAAGFAALASIMSLIGNMVASGFY